MWGVQASEKCGARSVAASQAALCNYKTAHACLLVHMGAAVSRHASKKRRLEAAAPRHAHAC